MKRIDYMQAQKVTASEWRLDHHTAKYAGLVHKRFPAKDFPITQDIAHRPDLIALRACGDPAAWWIIAQFNGIILPLKETTVGRVLRIPDIAAVRRYLQDSTAQQGSRVGSFVEV